MKIEQIENDKIQIILSKDDLENNKVTFHSFMSNSIETQNLFLTVLDLAEKEIGFKTNDYDIAIETLTLNNSDFILTITRLKKYNDLKPKKITISRKKYNYSNSYKFKNFDDFYDFFKLIKFSPQFTKSLFFFNDGFYYIYNNISKNDTKVVHLSEFASPTTLPSSLIRNFGKQLY